MAASATEMWTVDDGKVNVARVDETQSFDDIFAKYRATLRKLKVRGASGPKGAAAEF